MLEFFSPIKINGKKNMILAYGKKIPISSVHYAEVVHFDGCYDCLALGYISKKEKPVIKTTGEGKDFEILEFCNKLRGLKKWPEQKHVEYYHGGQIIGYYKWKRKINAYIQKKHDEERLHTKTVLN